MEPREPSVQNFKDADAKTAQGAMTLAEQHFRAGRLADAEVVLRDLLRREPSNADAVFALGLLAYSANKLDAAIQLLESAIEINPNAGRFHTNIAAMYGQRGESAKAIEHGRIAIALQPQLSEPHNNLGVAYLNGGDVAAAIDEFGTAIALDPKNSDALCNRANARLRLKRFAEAEQDARQAVSLSPGKVSVHNSLAAVLIARKDFVQAELAVRKAIAVAPGDWNAMHNLVLVLSSQEKRDDALMAANQAMQAFPTSGEARCLAATIHLDNGNLDTAFRLLQQSLAINPDYYDAVFALARYYFETRQMSKSVEQARRAIEITPRSAAAHNLLGCGLRDLGDVPGAIAAFEASLAADAQFSAAYTNLAETTTFTSTDDPRVKAMTAFAATLPPGDKDAEMQIHFALGKALDDLGQCDKAFEHLEKANSLKRRRVIYSEADTLNLFDRIQRNFTADVVSRFNGASDRSSVPIFVFGMPQAGTTLVAQLLAGHSTVASAGETRHVHDALVDLRGHVNGKRPFPESMHDAIPQDIAYFGNSLAGRLSREAPKSRRIVDGMTSNFFFLGLLRLALPHARFIHISRNPVDTCLSCYSKLFFGDINHAYDLAELGRYYRAYDALMKHWRAVLPAGSFLDVTYEGLATNPASEAQRIAAYCELAREPAFAAAADAVKPSPQSIGRWKLYAKHLAPLLTELRDLAH